MTIAIYPNCNIKKLKNITVEIAVKIKEAIKELYGYDLEIKKPNDLILNGKKICGILKETKINNARGMKAAGIAPAIIASITGLTLDEINNL